MKFINVLDSNRLDVFFNGVDHQEAQVIENEIRRMPESFFNQESGSWVVPNINGVRHALQQFGFPVPQKKNHLATISGYDERLYPFQIQGVEVLEQFDGRGLLAMEQGTGKTPTSLNWLRIHPDKRPAVLVVPANVKLNWLREIMNWMYGLGERPILVFGQRPVYLRSYSLIIINYDILPYHVKNLRRLEPQVIIADEVQYVKNMGAARTKALHELAYGVPHVIGLSGTPILSRPAEFWSILSIIRPDIWSNANKSRFHFRYCGPRKRGGDFEFKGHSNTQELHRVLTENVMYRVLKKDVLKDLPDKVYSVIPFKMNRQIAREYQTVVDTADWSSVRMANSFAAMTKLRKISWESKVKDVISWIEDILDRDEKLVVFVIHHKAVDTLVKYFKSRCVKYDGRDNIRQKEEAKTRFITDERVRLFVGNIDSAGVGIDGLQGAASQVAIAEFPWVPAKIDQAADRLHRIGQKDSVNVYHLIAEGTIEELIVDVLDSKRKVVGSVLDGTVDSEDGMIRYLITKIRKKAA